MRVDPPMGDRNTQNNIRRRTLQASRGRRRGNHCARCVLPRWMAISEVTKQVIAATTHVSPVLNTRVCVDIIRKRFAYDTYICTTMRKANHVWRQVSLHRMSSASVLWCFVGHVGMCLGRLSMLPADEGAKLRTKKLVDYESMDYGEPWLCCTAVDPSLGRCQ